MSVWAGSGLRFWTCQFWIIIKVLGLILLFFRLIFRILNGFNCFILWPSSGPLATWPVLNFDKNQNVFQSFELSIKRFKTSMLFSHSQISHNDIPIHQSIEQVYSAIHILIPFHSHSTQQIN